MCCMLYDSGKEESVCNVKIGSENLDLRELLYMRRNHLTNDNKF